jgi:hypothetical protein
MGELRRSGFRVSAGIPRGSATPPGGRVGAFGDSEPEVMRLRRLSGDSRGAPSSCAKFSLSHRARRFGCMIQKSLCMRHSAVSEPGKNDFQDEALIQIVDSALADATRRSGEWLVCRQGCTQCCIGVFPINQLDALRLRRGLEDLAVSSPARAERRTRPRSGCCRSPVTRLSGRSCDRITPR